MGYTVFTIISNPSTAVPLGGSPQVRAAMVGLPGGAVEQPVLEPSLVGYGWA